MNGMDPKEHYSIQNGMGGHEVLFNVFKVFKPNSSHSLRLPPCARATPRAPPPPPPPPPPPAAPPRRARAPRRSGSGLTSLNLKPYPVTRQLRLQPAPSGRPLSHDRAPARGARSSPQTREPSPVLISYLPDRTVTRATGRKYSQYAVKRHPLRKCVAGRDSGRGPAPSLVSGLRPHLDRATARPQAFHCFFFAATAVGAGASAA